MSTHPSHTLHAHSLDAYSATRDLRDTRREAVYQALLGRQMTDRETMRTLGFTDMNAVRPRITDLIGEYWVVEAGRVVDQLTKRPVRVCKGLNAAERTALLTRLGVAARPEVQAERLPMEDVEVAA